MKLTIHGSFELALKKDGFVPIIHGLTQKGPITLADTFYTRESWSNSVAFSNYLPTYAYLGIHFSTTSPIVFKEILIQFHGLYNYIGTTGKKFNNLTNTTEWSMAYRAPEPIFFTINDQLSGKIVYEGLVNSEDNKSEFEERVWVGLSYQNNIDFESLSKDLNCLRSFFSFLSNRIIYPTNILLNYNSPGDHVKLFYSNIFMEKSYTHNYRELVKFADILGFFSNYVKSWFEKFSVLSPPINIRTHSFYLDQSYTDERFFNTVRALESFHRSSRENFLFPKEEYSALISDIKQNNPLDDKYKEWFNNIFNFGNELPLKMRLLSLFDELPKSIAESLSDDTTWLASMIKNTRNNYAHRSEDRSNKALTKIQQVKSTVSLEALLSFFILKEVGIADEILLPNLVESLEKISKSV